MPWMKHTLIVMIPSEKRPNNRQFKRVAQQQQQQDNAECLESWKEIRSQRSFSRTQSGVTRKVRGNNRRAWFSFDSTRGYPGEGPPHQAGGGPARGRRKPANKVRKCYICKQPGHMAQQCPIAAARQAGGAAAAADAAQQADEDLGPRVARQQPEEKEREVKEEETPEEKRERKRAALFADMVAKASTALLLKDPRNQDDRTVVTRSITAIARQGALHELTGDVSGLVTAAYSQGLSRAVDQRIARAERDAVAGHLGAGEAAQRAFFGAETPFVTDVRWKALWKDPIDKVTLWESIPSRSLYSASALVTALFGFIRAARTFLCALSEERAKRVGISHLLTQLIPGTSEIVSPALDLVVNYVFDKYFHGRGKAIQLIFKLFMTAWRYAGLRGVSSAVLAFIEVRRNGLSSQFLPRLCAHLALSIMPLPAAVLLHTLWNLSVSREMRLAVTECDEDLTSSRSVVADVCCADYTMKATPTQSDYCRVPGEPDCKIGFGCRRGWGVESVIPTVFRNCIHNEKISMDGRVGKKLPAHDSPKRTLEIVLHWGRVFRKQCRDLSDKIQRVRKPVPFPQWASSFPPAKRDMFLQMKKDGIEIPKPVASSFIKRELAGKLPHDVQFKDPRFIQGCPVEMSALCGPSLRVLAKNTRQGLRPIHYTPAEISSGRQIVYTCGLSAEQVGTEFGKAIELMTSLCEPGEKVVFLEDDQSRFDLHLLEGPFNALDKIYRMKLPRKVARLLRRRISRGRTVHGTRYSIPWTMQSGWPDTSVGDTLINAIMKRHIHGIGRKWISIICGDDSVTITTDREIERLGGVQAIIKEYADFGMEVEAVLQADPLSVGFCSGRFMPLGDSFVLMPKTGRLLGKLCWDMTDRNPAGQKAWLRGICATLEHYGQLDLILASLAEGLRHSLGDGKTIAPMRSEYKHWLSDRHVINKDDVLQYYDHHYGLSADEVRHVCEVLRAARWGDLCRDRLVCELAAQDV